MIRLSSGFYNQLNNLADRLKKIKGEERTVEYYLEGIDKMARSAKRLLFGYFIRVNYPVGFQEGKTKLKNIEEFIERNE